jgi:hypothetical protein
MHIVSLSFFVITQAFMNLLTIVAALGSTTLSPMVSSAGTFCAFAGALW